MIVKKIKAYFGKRKERKRISEQYALEKACVDYFNKCVPRVDDFTKLVDNVPIGRDGLPLLIKSDNNSYPLQAIEARISDVWDEMRLYYGDYPYLYTPEWVMQIKDFPSELWLSVEDYPRPTCTTLLLCDYKGHYEVVEYAHKTWVTELCFPVKPTRYFVLKFLDEDK